MLEEVCGAVCLIRLGPRAGVDPHAYGGGLGVRRVLGSNLEKPIDISKRGLKSSQGDQVEGGARGFTVNPFFSVVVWVLTGEETGEAKPRLMGRERPARPRRPCARLRASLRDAMDADGVGVIIALSGLEQSFFFLRRFARFGSALGKKWLGNGRMGTTRDTRKDLSLLVLVGTYLYHPPYLRYLTLPPR